MKVDKKKTAHTFGRIRRNIYTTPKENAFPIPTFKMNCPDSLLWNKAKRFLLICLLQLQRRKITKTLAISVLVNCYFFAKVRYFLFLEEIVNFFSWQVPKIERCEEQIEVKL